MSKNEESKNLLNLFRSSRKNEDLLRITTYVILFLTLFLFIIGQYVPIGSWQFYATILFITGILLINIFWLEIENRFQSDVNANLFFVIACAILTILAAWVGRFYNVFFIVFMIAAQAFITMKAKTAFIAISVFVSIYILAMWKIGIDADGLINLVLALLVGLVFVITMSLVLTRYAEQTERAEKLADQLRTANQELLAARQIEKNLATAEERVRLAREIHDGIGHHLTALNIQLQAAEKMIADKPEKALDAIRICREESKAALEEVRHSVAVMRRTPLDGKTLQEALLELVKDFETASEKTIQLLIPEDFPTMSSQIALTIFRAVQEGLTNIQKHAADAGEIKIQLANNSGQLNLSIVDDGSVSTIDNTTSGFGLAGLQERAEQLGGTLRSSTLSDQGFELNITLPLREESYD